jgi:hypothetical protein
MKQLMMIAMLALAASAVAQPTEGDRESRREEIEQKKVAYISSTLTLTTAEAQAFWPVYNEYQAELKSLRSNAKNELGRPSEWKGKYNEKEIDQFMNARFAYERKKVEMDEIYYKKFKAVMPLEKVALYYEAEHEFKKELMRSMRGSKFEERGPQGK